MPLSDKIDRIKKYIIANPNIGSISESEITYVYQDLIDCVIDLNHFYYIENNPMVSDKEYDDFFDYLKNIEEYFPHIISWNSPTQWLVWQIAEWFNQVSHKIKLLSLENTYNSRDLFDRDERIKKILTKNWLDHSVSYSLEPKFDGLSVELIYKDWLLYQAITRWDGWVGDDITENVKTIKNIPKKINSDSLLSSELRVRWEILMPKSVWQKLNIEREKLWENSFANTRNAAAWSIKLLDNNEVRKRNLHCFVYDVLDQEISKLWLLDLEKMWLPVFPWKEDNLSIQDVVNICEDENTKSYLQGQDYDFDWLVIKVMDGFLRENIWQTEHHPRWAVAYKFPAQQVSTKVLSIDFQIWRTWIITPVANLEPVKLSGAVISRTTLHNFDFVKQKDIRVWDYVRLQRSGEVIPYIVWVIKDKRDWSEIEVFPPNDCPICKSKVDNVDIHYYCSNESCPSQIKSKLEHFVSKQCMDIDGIWESIIDVLVDQKIVSSFPDLYKLVDFNYQILLNKFPWFADKKISEIVNQLNESKFKPLWRILNALWISHVWKKTAVMINESLISNYSLKNHESTPLEFLIKNMTDKDFLSNIFGIWEKTVDFIIQFFLDKKNLEILYILDEFGINFDPIKYYKDKENLWIFEWLNNWSFSITWSFPVSREAIIESMQKNGRTYNENPNKNTNVMLVWDRPWSKKSKAEDMSIKIYDWRETIVSHFPFIWELSKNQSIKTNIQNQSLF